MTTEAGRKLLASAWKLLPGEPLLGASIRAIEEESAAKARAVAVFEIERSITWLGDADGITGDEMRDLLHDTLRRIRAALPGES